LDEIQKYLDLRGQVSAIGVQSARHYRFWLPSRQDGRKSLRDSWVESNIQRQNCNPSPVQHELSMHEGVICHNSGRDIGRNGLSCL